jgi:hypothetical protein
VVKIIRPKQEIQEPQPNVEVPKEEVDYDGEETTSSGYTALTEDKPKPQRFNFIKFHNLPKTLEEFDTMKTSWIGFEYALYVIGIKAEDLRRRLEAGKLPYRDEKRMRKDRGKTPGNQRFWMESKRKQ